MLNLYLSNGIIVYGASDYEYRDDRKWVYLIDQNGHSWAIKPKHIIASEVVK